jgi:hypothetical protein
MVIAADVRYTCGSMLSHHSRGKLMVDVGTERLLNLLHAALLEADAINDTLIAAMLAECIDAVERSKR